MTAWFEHAAVAKILLFGLLVGAVLPALFAVGVRLNAVGAGASDAGRRHPVYTVISWLLFGLVVVAIVVGVLFIARDFIAHQTGIYLLGAQPK
ncbi:putative transmembrane protein [Mycolicibacterium hassiacum DSM 44199]|uniref:Putative transmembrane protein n=1 Tax=Mycolicibacterium hassiacum (strain DSM 44199 / CIP 105218 / JCM 12690 / 3849) TaxID=1122247 RepID=K5BHT5_MYCHD|nr:hypothetical protein [Mycolicibacterium hassiacum]EKF25136.1 putative transmembrane protein [Mycolicibacterium hassiacum DSM 44199]MBX5487063.1 hypothetical protein [Mycolicibacterium hassiacum]MDA4087885.1 membrane protein [Mycolicibacterium hassiacum DSM 44199]PZN17531.1 MAG: hypothetical protein DIU75_19035 [Mycolicibacterium hassiacum]VCT93176.1 hypothetical protein MHAS_04915 [Mycolicibacterium hassiacum DSM 44199]